MRLIKAKVKYFGCYETLEFDFSSLGLALVSGPTKAGKSTVLDIAPWIMFGLTSKESAADDIRSWFAEEPTEGILELETAAGLIEIHRVRGDKPSQNDLYWLEQNSTEEIRGKDLKDTQKRLDERLGVSADLFIVGSYIHQFSSADNFFLAKAKDRRDILEKLSDLSMPIKLASKASEARKQKNKDLQQVMTEKASFEGQLMSLNRTRLNIVDNKTKFERQHSEKIEGLKYKVKNFELERQKDAGQLTSKIEMLAKLIVNPQEFDDRKAQLKAQIMAVERLKVEYKQQKEKFNDSKIQRGSLMAELDRYCALGSDTCPTCLGPTANENLGSRVAQIEVELNKLDRIIEKQEKDVQNLEKGIEVQAKLSDAYEKLGYERDKNNSLIKEFEDLKARVTVLKSTKNNYADILQEALEEKNPYEADLVKVDKEINDVQAKIEETQQYIQDVEYLISSLNWLYDTSFEIRTYMLEQAKVEIEKSTNEYLEKYFDADLRVKLSFDGTDKLNVDIMNQGYNCPYKQLSGGERCMLKLTFTLSIMKQAENAAGVKFTTIMLDEALDGLDSSLKSKAFGLLQSLERDYETILLIDHFEEFQNLFTNKFTVTNRNGISELSLD